VRTPSLLLFLLLAACGTTKKNFGENLTQVNCERLEECAKGDFDTLYTSVDDCVARSDDTSGCYSDHCDFDRDNANQCLDRVAAADCAEIVDGSAYTDCGQVWTGCDGGEGACVSSD
jgi:hypothetical protein